MSEKLQAIWDKALTILSDKLDKSDITIDDVNKIVFIAKSIAQKDSEDFLRQYCSMALTQINENADAEEVEATEDSLI